MESLRLTLEIAGGLILVGGAFVGAFRWIAKRARAYIAPKVSFALEFCSVYDDMLAVKHVFKAKEGNSIPVIGAGLYELESITSGHVVADGWIEKLSKDGTSGCFLTCLPTCYKDISDFERLRPFVRDARGELFFGELIDPGELRAAFEPDRNNRIV